MKFVLMAFAAAGISSGSALALAETPVPPAEEEKIKATIEGFEFEALANIQPAWQKRATGDGARWSCDHSQTPQEAKWRWRGERRRAGQAQLP